MQPQHRPGGKERSKYSTWTQFFTVGFLLLAGGVPVREVAAQGMILPRPIPDLPRPAALPVKQQRVVVHIDSGVARAEVEQTFVNPYSGELEGTFLFPLPEGATVGNFRMTVDREPVEGRILDRDEARAIYEAYVRRMVDPALLEYAGRGAFRARVFPIPARGEKKVQIGYSQPLPFESGVYEFRYPLGGASPGGVQSREIAERTFADFPATSIEVTLRLPQPLRAVYSPTHDVSVRRVDDRTARISFEVRTWDEAREFRLFYTVSEKEFGLNLLAHRRGDEPGYFMLMIAPKREVPARAVAAKEIVFVCDTSGSMSGAKIEQAKSALRFILENLNPHDRFNIIGFNSEVEPFRKALVEVTPESLKQARQFVEGIRAAGGTAIDDALAAALESLPTARLADDSPRRAMIVFLTDGQPTVGETNPQRILENFRRRAGDRARVFVFGVGDDVNTLLLDRLARDGAGTVEYVRPHEDLELKVSAFYTKIANPVLTDLELALPGVEIAELYPRRLPDLFAGSQLIVFGRYRRPGAVTARLTGRLAGEPRSFTYALRLPESERDHAFIPRLWASRKIGALLEEIRLHGESVELKNEVIRLSKEHGIVTPYTSFLIEEPRLPHPAGVPRRDRGGYSGYPVPSVPSAPGAAAGGGFREESLRQSTGTAAVEASQRIGDLKARVVETEETGALRRVGERLFERRGEVWVQTTYTEKTPTLAVKWGSAAYFELVRLRPDLGPVLALGKKVVFLLGSGQAVRVDDRGRESLTAADRKLLQAR